ncbi:hypothetical protein ACHQM5_011183 [Ranunculus cassubicifolius]
MDLETENRIASVLMKEAAELRREADKEGVHAYLRQRNVRLRPNSRFLTATVLGVQQANRVAEVNEMWRLRKLEQEVHDGRPESSRDKRRNHKDSPRSTSSMHREYDESRRRDGTRHMEHTSSEVPASRITDSDDSYYSSGDDDGGLKDEDVEHFLHSRVKRGRGGVGARMDEPGPYLPRSSASPDLREKEDWERRVLGPEKPPSLRRKRSHEGESDDDEDDKWKKAKKVKLESSKKHSKKHKRKREERKSRHKHKRRH